MSKQKMLKTFILIMVGFVPVVLANVPRSNEIVDDGVIYRNLHEIRITQEKFVDFDTDIKRLDLDVQKLSAQKKLREKNVPHRISAPLNRILHTSYKVDVVNPLLKTR